MVGNYFDSLSVQEQFDSSLWEKAVSLELLSKKRIYLLFGTYGRIVRTRTVPTGIYE